MTFKPLFQAAQDTTSCRSDEIGLKSTFLGPQSENGEWLSKLVEDILQRWFVWRRGLYPTDGRAISWRDQADPEFVRRREIFERVVEQLAIRFEAEVPKFSPRYIGHMFTETSLPALVGHIVALLHNPNNISGESSQVGVKIEDEAISALCQMVGYTGILSGHGFGHFTSGGTIANFEAMTRARGRLAQWIAYAAYGAKRNGEKANLMDAAHMGWQKYGSLRSKLDRFGEKETIKEQFNFLHANPFSIAARLTECFTAAFEGPVVLVPQNRHYSWKKGMEMLGLGDEALWAIGLDQEGRLSIPHLRELLGRAERESRPVMMVVSVAGTTELGSFDPIHEVNELLSEWRAHRGRHIWHHVDAAYGGFFCSLLDDHEPSAPRHLLPALAAMGRSDSITLDPHKLGYVPYASGAILVRTSQDYLLETSAAPYIQYSGRDRGPYTIEGSRPATGAAATWMIAHTVGFDRGGYGMILRRTLRIKSEIARQIVEAKLPLWIAPGCDSNVLCFVAAKKGEALSITNQRTRRLYEVFSPTGQGEFIVSKTTLARDQYGDYIDHFSSGWAAAHDEGQLTLIRMCILNPFFDSKEMNVKFSRHLIDALGNALSSIPL